MIDKLLDTLLDSIAKLERPALLQLRRRINDRLHELEDKQHAAVVADMSMPHGWGDDDGNKTDGED